MVVSFAQVHKSCLATKAGKPGLEALQIASSTRKFWAADSRQEDFSAQPINIPGKMGKDICECRRCPTLSTVSMHHFDRNT